MSQSLDLSSPPQVGGRRFQVLSLSGGGVRGLYTACVLEGLEARSGVALHECFDLIAGTSIGGIIAMGLALGRRASEVRELVQSASPRIFPSPTPLWSGLRGLFRARFEVGPLREVIEAVVGADTRLGDLRTPLLVPAVALTGGAAQIFRSPHHGAHTVHADTRLIDVALTTAAAPMVFPIALIGNARYVDGGLIAHAPDALAVHEAQVFFGKRSDDIVLLSVGTTRDLTALAGGGNPSRGLLYWMKKARLADVVVGAQQSLSLQMASESLGDRHVIINTPRSREQGDSVALDRADETAIATLKSMAEHALDDAGRDARVSRLLAHRTVAGDV
ncbi:MAG: putative acylesterase/phospholipase RssA [Gammaproteobacteria bacterium]|jgi:predicted acylesterase/phospholipase RssA